MISVGRVFGWHSRKMGRARSQTLSGFDAVFGHARGLSVQARARREREEDRRRHQALHKAVDTAFASGYAKGLESECGSRHAADALANYFLANATTPDAGGGVAVRYESLVNTFVEHANTAVGMEELVGICVLGVQGQPRDCSEFARPAVEAIGRYLSDHCVDDRGRVRLRAQRVIMRCFPNERDLPLTYYQYLEPICRGLAAVVKEAPMLAGAPRVRPSGADRQTGNEVAVNLAWAMVYAPAEALVGPLRSWVDAFAQRLARGGMTDTEVKALEEVILEHELFHAGLKSEDGVFVSAFASVVEGLSAT
jgi:hypothetical protein